MIKYVEGLNFSLLQQGGTWKLHLVRFWNQTPEKKKKKTQARKHQADWPRRALGGLLRAASPKPAGISPLRAQANGAALHGDTEVTRQPLHLCGNPWWMANQHGCGLVYSEGSLWSGNGSKKGKTLFFDFKQDEQQRLFPKGVGV